MITKQFVPSNLAEQLAAHLHCDPYRIMFHTTVYAVDTQKFKLGSLSQNTDIAVLQIGVRSHLPFDSHSLLQAVDVARQTDNPVIWGYIHQQIDEGTAEARQAYQLALADIADAKQRLTQPLVIQAGETQPDFYIRVCQSRQSELTADFLDWLRRQYVFAHWDQANGEQLLPDYPMAVDILADYYGIDLEAVEQQRVELLAGLRASYAKEDDQLSTVKPEGEQQNDTAQMAQAPASQSAC